MSKTMIEVANDWKKIRSNLGTLINDIDGKINDAEYQQRKVDEAYQRGLDDAWEAAMKLSIMTPEEAEKVFTGAEKYNRFNLGYSGAEAVKKLKAYEEQKKAEEEAEIKVGDVLQHKGNHNTKIAVTGIHDSGMISGICVGNDDINNLGSAYTNRDPINWEKTNLHFPEIAELLKAMEETDG